MRLTAISSVPLELRDLLEIIRRDFSGDISNDKVEFELNISRLLGVEYTSTFQSGSLAFYNLLELLKANMDEARREVIVPAYTCPSLCYAIRDAGLVPVFVDISSTFYPNLDDVYRSVSSKTLAVVVVHMFRYTSFPISDIKVSLKSRGYSPYIIEDLCQALGDIREDIVGGKSDFYILSFGHSKMITTLNGGAILSNRDNHLRLIKRDHKMTSQNKLVFILKFLFVYLCQFDLIYFWVQKYKALRRKNDKYDLGSFKIKNFSNRELDLYQYSLGVKMISKISYFNHDRKSNAGIYDRFFEEKNYVKTFSHNDYFWRYPVVFKDSSVKSVFQREFKSRGIYASTGNYPVADEVPEMKDFVESAKYPMAKDISSKILLFPVHPALERNRLISVLNNINISL